MAGYDEEFGNLTNSSKGLGELTDKAIRYGRTKSPYDRLIPSNLYFSRKRNERKQDIYNILLYRFLNEKAYSILVGIAKKGRFFDYTGSLRYSYQAFVSIDNPNYPTVAYSIKKGDLAPIQNIPPIRGKNKVWGKYKIDKFNKNGKQRVVRRKAFPRYALRQSGDDYTKVLDKRAGEDENWFGGTRIYNSYTKRKNRTRRYLKPAESWLPHKADSHKYSKIIGAGSPNKYEAQLMIVNSSPVSTFRHVRNRIFVQKKGSSFISNKDVGELSMAIGKVSAKLLEKRIYDAAFYSKYKNEKKSRRKYL